MNYKHVDGLITAAEVASLESYCQDALRSNSFPGMVVSYFDGNGPDRKMVRMERMIEHLEANTGIALLERCAGLVRLETGQDTILFKDKINFRYPGLAGFGAHQDAAAGWTEYSPLFHSIAIFLRDTSAHNGGFEFSLEDPKATFYSNVNGQISKDDFDAFPRCNIEARAGDAIFFDSFAPHRSHVNRTDSVIPHLILTFNPAAHGDSRALYYERKMAAMHGDDGEYVFRVFDFDDRRTNTET